MPWSASSCSLLALGAGRPGVMNLLNISSGVYESKGMRQVYRSRYWGIFPHLMLNNTPNWSIIDVYAI